MWQMVVSNLDDWEKENFQEGMDLGSSNSGSSVIYPVPNMEVSLSLGHSKGSTHSDLKGA